MWGVYSVAKESKSTDAMIPQAGGKPVGLVNGLPPPSIFGDGTTDIAIPRDGDSGAGDDSEKTAAAYQSPPPAATSEVAREAPAASGEQVTAAPTSPDHTTTNGGVHSTENANSAQNGGGGDVVGLPGGGLPQ